MNEVKKKPMEKFCSLRKIFLSGQFYSQDSYLFVARYLLPSEDESMDNSELEDEIKDSDTERIVYFWQGRNANNTAWLFFNFTYIFLSKYFILK